MYRVVLSVQPRHENTRKPHTQLSAPSHLVELSRVFIVVPNLKESLLRKETSILGILEEIRELPLGALQCPKITAVECQEDRSRALTSSGFPKISKVFYSIEC